MSYIPKPWRVGKTDLGLAPLPELMGIVNCTPDSFFDGGLHETCEAAVSHALKLLEEGATILDIGGESSRPGAQAVSEEEELSRVIPVIQRLATLKLAKPFWISIDTTKAKVAQAAVAAGAHIINDISMASLDSQMGSIMASSGASVVLNHMQGEPRTMQLNPSYTDVVKEVGQALVVAAQRLQQVGVPAEKICLDPGIGFGKRLEDNYALIQRAQEFHSLGYPLLYGMSRKSFIGRTLGLEQSDRLIPSVISAVEVARQGVQVLRVHDVQATREALLMWNALRGPKPL